MSNIVKQSVRPIRPSKIKFFWCQGIFSLILISKIGVKMNLRIIKKNHEADQEKCFSQKRFQTRMTVQRTRRQRGI